MDFSILTPRKRAPKRSKRKNRRRKRKLAQNLPPKRKLPKPQRRHEARDSNSSKRATISIKYGAFGPFGGASAGRKPSAPPPPPEPIKIAISKPAPAIAGAPAPKGRRRARKRAWLVDGRALDISALCPMHYQPWKSPDHPTAPLERARIIGNKVSVDAVFARVGLALDLRDNSFVTMLVGPPGVGKHTAIFSAAKLHNRRVVSLDATSMNPSARGFAHEVYSHLFPWTGSNIVLTGVDGIREEQMETLLQALENSVASMPRSHNPLWMLANSTGSMLIRTLRAHQGAVCLMFDRPSQREMWDMALAGGASQTTNTHRAVLAANGDLRRMTGALERLQDKKERIGVGDSGDVMGADPFALVTCMLGGNERFGLKCMTKAAVADFEPLIYGDLSFVMDVAAENFPSHFGIDDCIELTHAFSNMDLLTPFIPGRENSAGHSTHQLVAHLLPHQIINHRPRGFRWGGARASKRGQALGLRLDEKERLCELAAGEPPEAAEQMTAHDWLDIEAMCPYRRTPLSGRHVSVQ